VKSATSSRGLGRLLVKTRLVVGAAIGNRKARILGAGIVGVFAFWIFVPVVQFDDPLSTVILDRDGELLGATIAADGQWRFGVARTVPDKFVAAITRFEDRRFFDHPGVDPLAIARAFVHNLRHRRVVSGGSTLTMQVVRLSRKGRPRTVGEKLVEAVLALRLELSLSKTQILGLWAAYAPFGGNIVGLDAAAWRYFGHDAEQLSWAETATLAVLPNSPALIHPGRNRDRLLAKRNRLLDSLREAGVIDAMACRLGKLEPLPPAPQALPMLAPHLLSRVQASRSSYQWRTGDASPWVRTTLRKQVQSRAAGILARHRLALLSNNIHNTAALILEVRTGRVVSYHGNHTSFDAAEHENWVDVVPAPRSTGSILKPLLFAAMLESGEVLPGQLIPDVPTRLGAFHPENFDRAYSGAVPAEMALARSLNVPAVRMLRSYGIDRFCAFLKRLGMTSLFRPAREYGLALILGGAEGSLWDITGIYAGMARSVVTFGERSARGSVFHSPILLHEQQRRLPRTAGIVPPIHAAACYLTLKAMLEVERPGDELAWRTFDSSRRIAWKTGTSYGYRDAWAVGVTPRHAVGVWVGNADGEGRPGLTGYSAAAPILFELFDLLPGDEWFDEPEADLFEIEVCGQSGMRKGQHCGTSRRRLVTEACLDSPPCGYCRLLHLDGDGSRVHGDCEPISSIRTMTWFVLPPAMESFYRRQHSSYRPPPPYRSDCRAMLDASGIASLSCIYPKENSQVYVPLEIDGSLGRVVFEAAHRDPDAHIYWHLDDAYFGATRDIHEMAFAPPPGAHVLTLVDENGEMVRRRFSVLPRS
jgi:penicillin-binding protein 1C